MLCAKCFKGSCSEQYYEDSAISIYITNEETEA